MEKIKIEVLEDYFTGDSFKDFVREIKKYPQLSDDESRELFDRYK